jgi:hypothetical protein
MSRVRYGEHIRAEPGTACLTCGSAERQPRTDHCHKHGWVRGGLCPSCNSLMALIDRRISPRDSALAHPLTLSALVEHVSRCPECEPLCADDLGPTVSLRGPGRVDVTALKIRIPDEMRDRIKQAAADDKRSMNGEIEWLLGDSLDRRENGEQQ